MDVLLGVGNGRNGDDGVGPYVARRLDAKGWKGIDCGTVPESYTSAVRRESPARVVIVDATEMGLAPGAIRLVDEEKIPQLAISTHTMPLSMLMGYLKTFCGSVSLVGIQPKSTLGSEGMCEEVRKSGDEAARRVADGSFTSFSRL